MFYITDLLKMLVNFSAAFYCYHYCVFFGYDFFFYSSIVTL